MPYMMYGFTDSLLTHPTDQALESLSWNGITAFYEVVEGLTLRPSRANMRAFQTRLESLMACTSALLPLRFGTIVAEQQPIIDNILRPYEAELQANFNQVRDCYEASLKVSWDQSLLMSEVRQAYPQLAQPVETLDINSRIALGQQVEQAMQSIHQRTEEQVLAHLQGRYQQFIAQPCEPLCSLNGAFLVSNGSSAAFEAAVFEADAALGGRLALKLVTPLPVYSFINLTIRTSS